MEGAEEAVAEAEPPRNVLVKARLRDAIDGYAGTPQETWGQPPEVDTATADLVAALSAKEACREGALVLAAIALAEKRPLNLVDVSAGDLQQPPRAPRLAGDRTCSEELSRVLTKHGIPHTKGALQSSTYRSGYQAAQAKAPELNQYVTWASEPARTLGEIEAVFDLLARRLAEEAMRVPPLPKINRHALTHPRVAKLVDTLLAFPSKGAFQQYLFAATLSVELDATGTGRRATTKDVFGTDRAAKTAGDVEVRKGQALHEAYEISAENWRKKIGQALEVVQNRDELEDKITIAADATGATGEAILAELSREAPAGVQVDRLDVVVVDLADTVKAKLGGLAKGDRAEVIQKLYQLLVTYCGGNNPKVVEQLVEQLVTLELADEPGPDELGQV